MSMHDDDGEPIDVGLLVDASGSERAQIRGRRNQVAFFVVLLLPFAAMASGVRNPLAAVAHEAEAVLPASTAAAAAAASPPPTAAAGTPPVATPLPPPAAAAPVAVPAGAAGSALTTPPATPWRLVRAGASPKTSSWSGVAIDGGDPEHPNGGCAPDQVEPDPVTACGRLCLKYRDKGCRYFYINLEGGADRGFTIARGRCCLKDSYAGEGEDPVGPGSEQYWWDKQEGTATLNLNNAAFYEMVVPAAAATSTVVASRGER